MAPLITDWQPAPTGAGPGAALPPLAAPPRAELLIYRVAVPDFAGREAALAALLPSEERARAARFRQPTDRHRFLVGRAGLRYLLAEQLGQAPEQIRLTLNVFGKPQLLAPAPLQFNIAHSGDWVVLALGVRAVGIDVEKVESDFEFAAVATHCFTAAEQHYLDRSPAPRATFYDLWTRQEARAKAAGRGLSEVATTDPAARGGVGSWLVRGLEVAPGYPGALAYPFDWQPVVRFYTFDTSRIG